jgi:hypothetical protein
MDTTNIPVPIDSHHKAPDMVIADPGMRVIFGRRYPRLGGQFSTPIHTLSSRDDDLGQLRIALRPDGRRQQQHRRERERDTGRALEVPALHHPPPVYSADSHSNY